MGPIWGRQDPGGPHVGPMSLATWQVNAITGDDISLFVAMRQVATIYSMYDKQFLVPMKDTVKLHYAL